MSNSIKVDSAPVSHKLPGIKRESAVSYHKDGNEAETIRAFGLYDRADNQKLLDLIRWAHYNNVTLTIHPGRI